MRSSIRRSVASVGRSAYKLHRLAIRPMATETAPAVQKDSSSGSVTSATSSTYASAAAPKPAPVVVQRGGSTVFGRMGAFLVGMALGGAVGAYYLREEVWDSTVYTQKVLKALHADVVDSNRELRKRVSALEQQMAEQRK